MDALSIYFNAILQDALRPGRRVRRPNTVKAIAAFALRSARLPRRIYSTTAGRRFARKDAAPRRPG